MAGIRKPAGAGKADHVASVKITCAAGQQMDPAESIIFRQRDLLPVCDICKKTSTGEAVRRKYEE